MAELEFTDWDGGRLRVNREDAAIFAAHGLTTFAALMSFSGGELARRVSARSTVRFTLADESGERAFFLKRHERRPFRELWKPLLRLTYPVWGARAEWQAILWFHAAGIPTMIPAALGESHGQSLLVTRALDGCKCLLDWAEEWRQGGAAPRGALAWGPAVPRHLIERVAAIARAMHEAGLHHQDFYLNHLFMASPVEPADVRVIDLGRVRRRRKLGARWIIKDLAQLDYSARRISPIDRLRFLRYYFGRRLKPADRALIARVRAKSRAIDRHTQKNSL